MENLNQKLEELRRELEKNPARDPELAKLVSSLNDDIGHALASEGNKPEKIKGLSSQAQALSARFAAQHPDLEFALRNLANALENIGI
ncbi:MAG: hypothetical protein JWR22_1845 [Herminiimonas sp.]|nr:hypothetical protein [Herminiimonas sp.]